jgi:ketose-bisphosphate aldolase
MVLVSMKEMLLKALDEGYAVGQFNLNNLEFTQAILRAAQEEKSPVILGVSEAYIPYMGGLPCITGMVKSLIEHYGITVPVALHLDHGSTFEVCIQALHAGFTSVMIDDSHHPFEHNIEVTRRVTEIAHVLGASVEAELGRITGWEDDLVVDEAEGILRDKPRNFFLERYNDAYIEETKLFIACVLQDQPVPVDGNDGLQAELTALAANLSVQLKRPVKLNEALELAVQHSVKS